MKLNQRGFTLLEMIIAMTMLAVIVGMMTAALSMAYRTLEKGEKKTARLERQKILFPLLESQMQSAFSSYYNKEGEVKSRFVGQKDALEFAANYSLWRGVGGNCLVKYTIKNDDQGGSFLHIEERMLGLDTAEETRLTENYESIAFEYFLESALEEGKWVDVWPEDEKKLPRKIRIHFKNGLKKKTLTADVFIRSNPSTAAWGMKSTEKK